tara:strand:+ start:4366 stop:4536 length:171 start_codon:yes stop_codon:yes gene_type:complete
LAIHGERVVTGALVASCAAGHMGPAIHAEAAAGLARLDPSAQALTGLVGEPYSSRF